MYILFYGVTNFWSFGENVVIWIRKEDDAFGAKGLSVTDSARRAVERAVGLDHDDRLTEVVVEEATHVVEVWKSTEVAVNQTAFLDCIGTVGNLKMEK